jgi:hypothetical protein
MRFYCNQVTQSCDGDGRTDGHSHVFVREQVVIVITVSIIMSPPPHSGIYGFIIITIISSVAQLHLCMRVCTHWKRIRDNVYSPVFKGNFTRFCTVP